MRRILFDRKSLPFRTEFSLLGKRVSLSTNSHAILALASRWTHGTSTGTHFALQMEIFEDVSRLTKQRQQHHFRGMRHIVFALLGDGDFFAFDLLRQNVIGVVSSGTAEDAGFWERQLVPIAVGVLGTTFGVAPLHCACLDKNGRGLLVAGLSGAGKSTLSVALAKRGFALVSDDWTYVSESQGCTIAHGLGVPVKLLPDSVRYFPELSALEPVRTLNGEIAYEVDPSHVFGCAVKRDSCPQWLMFLERQMEPGCHITPCKKDHARNFFERYAERLPNEIPQAKMTRSAVIEQLTNCPCWMVRTGENPERTADEIARFCETH